VGRCYKKDSQGEWQWRALSIILPVGVNQAGSDDAIVIIPFMIYNKNAKVKGGE
jgi:hypothetical protein